ncbi:polysaccharide deacetylase family protein [Halalkalibacter okhensis]|uniref:Chitooligosaccharide deacetylase n=1 Tax=Halalkalibacter okhensis TaxID=333138 RepID=A0A0B0IBK0_9BACI|nr:polysaccharide deacetylase family protein [Halalkalibacter okhensis]KHF39933.1 chitooligosaccharide deacetylase [Halalkalibacter okhensis]
MKKKMLKLMLAVVLVSCFQISDVITVNAHETKSGESWQQFWWKKDKPDEPKEDFPDLRGGPENPERVRQVPVDMTILQQQFPDTFFLQGPTDQNRIALTFDDGPDPRYTEDVLNVLNQYNVPATFFLMGSRAVAYPEIVERMNNEGHIIGNHTYFHPNLVKEADIPTLEREVSRTEDVLNDIIGYRTSLFRPPYGFLYEELVDQLAQMQYLIMGWSVDSLDWQEDPPEVIASNVLDNVQPGAIILMHDGADWDGDRTNTIESLHQIIPTLQEEGYEFVTVPELLNVPFAK